MTLTEKMLTKNNITPKANQAPPASQSGAADVDEHGNKIIVDEQHNNVPKPGDPGYVDPAAPVFTIKDEELLAELALRGIKVANIDALKPTPPPAAQLSVEELAEAEEKRRNEIRSFALTNGKVKSTELDNFARESAMPVNDLAFSIYRTKRIAELKAANTPDDQIPEDKDLRTEFNEVNHLFADENDVKRKVSEQRLKNETELYLQDTYPSIYEMEHDYTQNAETLQLRNEYNTSVDEVINSIGTTIPFEIMEDNVAIPYPVTFSAEQLNDIKTIYNGDAMFNNLGKQKLPKESLAQAAKNSLITKNIQKVISDVAIAHASAKIDAMKKGRRVLPINSNIIEGDQKPVSAGVKKMLGKNKDARKN